MQKGRLHSAEELQLRGEALSENNGSLCWGPQRGYWGPWEDLPEPTFLESSGRLRGSPCCNIWALKIYRPQVNSATCPQPHRTRTAWTSVAQGPCTACFPSSLFKCWSEPSVGGSLQLEIHGPTPVLSIHTHTEGCALITCSCEAWMNTHTCVCTNVHVLMFQMCVSMHVCVWERGRSECVLVSLFI